MSFSVLVFLFVLMFSFGFIVQRTRALGFWQFIVIAFLLIVFLTIFGFTKNHLLVMFLSFFVGYLLPYASVLRGVGEAISNLINSIRYRDAYAEIKRKEAEIEELRRQYEDAKAGAWENRESQERERQKRQKEAEGFRQKKARSEEKQASASGSSQSSSGSSGSQGSGQHSYTRGASARERYLKTLGLDPNGSYTLSDIKKAFREKAMEAHPDRHHGKSEDVIREMEERFREIKNAFEGLVREL